MSFIAKQPNGKYCRFSTITDCPTDINMTREDYIKECVDRAVEQAEDVLNHHVRPFEQVKKCFIPNNMSKKEFKEVLKKMEDETAGYEEL